MKVSLRFPFEGQCMKIDVACRETPVEGFNSIRLARILPRRQNRKIDTVRLLPVELEEINFRIRDRPWSVKGRGTNDIGLGSSSISFRYPWVPLLA
ncbi:hypothetical protein HZH66_013833 [Vespula vulgaris]|uniref:Uncharacterized protein n=1 Tax=Vespula vulgaris TaxID=7454 RepID=A0A834MRY1_VESVU|nr:hypothetical protein HZH66_013833 [Vespula vulgaris]